MLEVSSSQLMHQSSDHSDPMIVSQADALQAEASTKLKGLLAAAAATPPAPVQVAGAPSKVDHFQATAPADISSNKRPRDLDDERTAKKHIPTQQEPIKHAVQKEAPAVPSKAAQCNQSTSNQASRSSAVQSTVPPLPTTVLSTKIAAAGPATSSAPKLTENSVSSLEGDCTEVEDIQAKVQAELAW